MSDAARQGPVVSGHQVLSAGFAAATAAFVTSRFGVAGTLLGAALTAMIITGGSAILRGYFESVTGNVRSLPTKLRSRKEQRKANRYAEPTTLPERPDLRDNFAGRMRAALGWFSHLPPLSRRSILTKGLIGAAVAFAISMGAVYAVEKGIGNSLSCGFWSKCPEGAEPGIHLVGDRGTGASSSLSLGRTKTKAVSGYQSRGLDHQQSGVRLNALQQNGVQQGGSYQQKGLDHQQPANSGAQPRQQVAEPNRQVAPAAVPGQQETPSSASPAPEQEPVQQGAPSGASPAPSQ